MTLHEITPSIEKGLPFRRASFPEKLYYYYDMNDKWFIQGNSETGCEIVMYTFDMKLDDLMATDWEIDEWDNHIVDTNKKVDE